MSDEDYLTDLATDITDEGGNVTVDTNEQGTSLTISRYRGEDLAHPTTIRTTNEALTAYLHSMADGAADHWPDSAGAAYGLLLVHLDEEMTVLAGNPDTIDITPKAMKPYRSRPRVEDPLPPGEYEWRA